MLSKVDIIAKKMMPTEVSPKANILRLAAYEQARRTLRRECEPDSSAVRSSEFNSQVGVVKKQKMAHKVSV